MSPSCPRYPQSLRGNRGPRACRLYTRCCSGRVTCRHLLSGSFRRLTSERTVLNRDPYAAIALTLVLWASSFPAIKTGLTAYSPLHLAALRFIVASLTLACLAPLLHVRVPHLADMPLLLALAAIGVAAYHVAVNSGEARVSASATAFIANIAPIFTITIGGIALRERIPLRGWFGVGLSLVGVWLIAYSEGGTVDVQIGSLILLLAAVCWSLFFVLQKPLLKSYTPIEVTCYSVWVGHHALVLLPSRLPRRDGIGKLGRYARGDLPGRLPDRGGILVLVVCLGACPCFESGDLHIPRPGPVGLDGLRVDW